MKVIFSTHKPDAGKSGKKKSDDTEHTEKKEKFPPQPPIFRLVQAFTLQNSLPLKLLGVLDFLQFKIVQFKFQ